MSSYSKWKDKWALVTGASSGIGAAFAKDLARSGVHVVLVARRLERLEALAAELSDGFGVQTLVLASDLAVSGAAQTMADELEAKGVEVELLVNNAGLGPAGAFSDGSLQSATNSIQVNITALTELTYLFIQKMKRRRSGNVILVGSVNAFMSVPLLRFTVRQRLTCAALVKRLRKSARTTMYLLRLYTRVELARSFRT